MRITNPIYLYFGMPFGTSRRADYYFSENLASKTIIYVNLAQQLTFAQYLPIKNYPYKIKGIYIIMKAEKLDFYGTVSAEISNSLGKKHGYELEAIGKFFKLDLERFKMIGVSINGADFICISLLCVDRHKSTAEKEHIVSMSMDIENEKDIFSILFNHLYIVLHDRFDEKYSNLNCDEEVRFDDFHELENEKK